METVSVSSLSFFFVGFSAENFVRFYNKVVPNRDFTHFTSISTFVSAKSAGLSFKMVESFPGRSLFLGPKGYPVNWAKPSKKASHFTLF
jgi:hypothetical protein